MTSPDSTTSENVVHGQKQETGNAVEIQHLTKTYAGADGDVTALNDVNLSIQHGDIYGIIGLSGAGKSTLVRCINRLENFESGTLTVLGQNVKTLSAEALRDLRSRVGMIFQSFNLMPSRTVIGNVEVPLQITGKLSRRQRHERAADLLNIVGLSKRINDYPNELSGGQKQRVAIARALANNPKILLSDEATSALDPNTTESILKLLRQLHDSLNITIILITHQMSIVKEICNDVAVIDHGTIVEQNSVFKVFSDPQAPLTKSFVATTSNLSKIDALLAQQSPVIPLGPGQLLVRLQYITKEISEPLVSHVSRQFGIDINIIFGDLDIVDGSPLGGIVAIFGGPSDRLTSAIHYFETRNVRVEVLKHV